MPDDTKAPTCSIFVSLVITGTLCMKIIGLFMLFDGFITTSTITGTKIKLG